MLNSDIMATITTLEELLRLAERGGHHMLAYLIDMALTEAREVVKAT